MSGAPVALFGATLDDLEALTALEARCHTHPWSERGLRDAIVPVAGEGTILVLRAPWGTADPERGIRAYCAFQVVAGEAHVHNLAVAPEARRQGLGRRLLGLALESAAARGAGVVHLEVRAANAAARALYHAMGFREVGRRAGYYSAPLDDAVLLSRDARAGRRDPNLESPPIKC